MLCAACFRPGHEAVSCYDLGKALIQGDFIKAHLGSDLLKTVVQAYKDRFGPKPSATANRISADILGSYCADNGITPSQVAEQYDWDSWIAPSEASSDEDSVDSRLETGPLEQVYSS